MYEGKKVGLGIVSHERPQFLTEAAASVHKYLHDIVDAFFIYDDGSDKRFRMQDVELPDGFTLELNTANRGVGYAKSRCMQVLLDYGCDYIFLMEDDMIVADSRAITGYIEASQRTGVHHFNYAHHGPINVDSGPYGPENLLESEVIDGIDVFSACVGSWSFYTRECLEEVGLMDPKLDKNAFEHVEHTLRCAKAGFTFRFWRFPDVAGSREWIKPQDEALTTSTIRTGNSNWWKDMHASLDYVKQKHPGVWDD